MNVALLYVCVLLRKIDGEHRYLAAMFVRHSSCNTTENQKYVILLTSDKLHFLDCETDLIRNNLPIRETQMVECSTSQSEGHIELLIQHSPKEELANETAPLTFQVVDAYLDLPRGHVNLEDEVKDESTIEDVHKRNEKEYTPVLEDMYLLKHDHYIQFQFLFKSIKQFLTDPDSNFPISGANDLSFFSAVSQISPNT